ncbi:MAG: OmpH family outer membrane protein [Bacteroidales bacterium]|jgi:outer membrane protein|nr:OmpH family outer membrane protein [Bacteroidales bacterium]
MKRTISSLAAVLVAVAFMTSCKTAASNKGAVQEGQAPEQKTEIAKGSIVYVRMDSLVKKYDMFNDLQSELEAKVSAIQDDLNKKGNNFQKKTSAFQDKLNKGLMTRSDAKEQSDKLMKEQEGLQALSQKKQAEIQDETNVLYRKVMDAIHKYLVKYNKSHKYSLILTTTSDSPTIIVGDESLDITNDVLNGLNEEYIKIKKNK